MSEEFIKGGASYLDERTAKLNNAAVSEYNQEVDAMFGRLHGNLSVGEENQSYNASDYLRVGFGDKRQAAQFAQEMTNQGFQTASAPVKLNGQYLVEVERERTVTHKPTVPNDTAAKEAIDKRISESFAKLHSQQNTSYNASEYERFSFADESGVTEFKDYMNKYGSQDNSGIQVFSFKDELSGRYVAEIKKDTSDVGADRLATNYKSDTGKDLTHYSVSSGTIDSYRKEYIKNNTTTETVSAESAISAYEANYGVEVESANPYRIADKPQSFGEAETSSLQDYLERETDDFGKAIRKTGDTLTVLGAFGASGGSEMQKATYFYGDVIVDGKIVDGKEKEFVERQHIKKTEKSIKTLNKGEPKQPRNIITKKIGEERFARQLKMHEDARRMAENAFIAEEGYVSKTLKGQGSRDGGVLDEMRGQINTGATIQQKINNSRDAFMRQAGVTFLKTNGEGVAIATAVNNTLGIDLTKGNVAREDMLEITNKFNEKMAEKGISFVDKKGNFDVEKLRGYDTTALASKLGKNVSVADAEKLKDTLIKLNSKDAWGGYSKEVGDLRNLALRKLTEGVGDKDLSDMVNTPMQAVKYTKQFGSAAQKYSAARKARIQARKAKKVGVGGKSKDNILDKMRNDLHKKNNKPYKADEKSLAKNVKKQEKKLSKLEKSEKSVFGRLNKLKAKVLQKIAQTKLGGALLAAHSAVMSFISSTVAPIIAGFLLLVFKLCAGGAIIIAIVCGITSIFERHFDDTIAYKIGEKLDKEQAKWLEDVTQIKDSGGDDLFKNRDKLIYGSEGKEFEEYMEEFDNLYFKKGGLFSSDKIYINPFYTEDNPELVTPDNDNSYALTEKDSFDGAVEVILNTNPNLFGRKDVPASEGVARGEEIDISDVDYDSSTYVSTESGHTDNIKDILAMLDTMYTFQVDDSSDSGIESILGQTPAGADWDAFKESLSNLWKKIKMIFNPKNWVAATINLFKGLTGNDEFVEYEGEATSNVKVSYKTLQSYCVMVYEISHQQILNLKVDFFPTKNLKFNVEGEEVNLLDEETMEMSDRFEELFDKMDEKEIHNLGYCTELDCQSYEVDMDTAEGGDSHVYPYIEDESGTKYDLSDEENGFAITISVDENMKDEDKEKLCVWETMFEDAASDPEETINRVVGNSCWTKKSTEEVSRSHFGTSYFAAQSAANNIPRTATFGSKDEFSYTEYVVRGHGGSCTARPSEGFITYDLVQIKYTYERDCKGKEEGVHNFYYCGGHISVISQGAIYSVTNEQLSMLALRDDEYQEALCKDFVLEENGYEDVYGKVLIGSEDEYGNQPVDYSSAAIAATTGAAAFPVQDVQGTLMPHYTGGGLNLKMDEGGVEWATGYEVYPKNLEGVENPIGVTAYHFRDIFDADSCVYKGCDVFPTAAKDDFTDYEGWSADNMTMAIAKVGSPWYDEFEFDRPVEFGMTQLTAQDINTIVDAVKGSGISEEREEAIKKALAFVGRGHYVEEGHEEHGFLSELCKSASNATITNDEGEVESTISYDANCTAGNSESFAKFILYFGGKITDLSEDIDANSSVSGLKPADIIVHKAVEEGEEEEALSNMELTTDEAKNLTAQACKTYCTDIYSVYIGKSSSDMQLQNGTVIKAGQYITVDLNVGGDGDEYKGNIIGTVYLRTLNADGWFDYVENKEVASPAPEPEDGDIEYNNAYVFNYPNYYWVTNPDERTKVYKFE